MSFAVEMGRVLLALGKEEDLGVTSSASVGSTTLAVMARVYDTHMVLRRSSARTLVVLGRFGLGYIGICPTASGMAAYPKFIRDTRTLFA